MNGFYGGNISPDYFIRKEGERKTLKKLGSLSGLALCGYVAIQNIISLIIQLVGLWDEYETNTYFQCGVDIILTFAGVLLPFALIGKLMKKHSGIQEPLVFERKVSKGKVVLAVFSGVGLCMAANIVSTLFIAVASLFGFQLTSPDVPMPDGIAGIFLSFVRVVVVAAMAEELALRGYIMGNLKKYGDAFAIGISAVVFALMHGNLVQAPFALIAGFAIGYFTVKTGTLWTGIIIHGLNNFISIALSYIIEYLGQDIGTVVYALLIYGLSFIGVICSLIFVVNNKNSKLQKSQSVLSLSEKMAAYFLNIPMVIALLVMVYVTSTYVEFGW